MNHFYFIVCALIIKFHLITSISLENSYFERYIRGTAIIHIMLEMDSNENTVKDYITKYINPNFKGIVSSRLSYNSNSNGNINLFLKESDHYLVAIYFDGGKREERKGFYDYINLRWQGNGSPHMYVFWKSYDHKFILQYNNIIKIYHFLNSNIFLNYLPKITRFILDKKTNEKKKKLEKLLDLITEISVLKAKEDFIKNLEHRIEENEDTREVISEFTNEIEDISMVFIDYVENIPIVGNMAKSGTEALKTIITVKDYPLNTLYEIFNNILDENRYVKTNNPKDVLENSLYFLGAIGDGVQKTSVDTIRNIGHGIKDVLKPITGNKVDNPVLDTIEDGFNEVANGVDILCNEVGNTLNDLKNFLMDLF